MAEAAPHGASQLLRRARQQPKPVVVLQWRYAGFGYARFGGAVRRRFSAGRNSSNLPANSFRQSRSCIRSRCTALTPEPKGGARCVSSARRDLRGGRGAILVSTATVCRIETSKGRINSCATAAGQPALLHMPRMRSRISTFALAIGAEPFVLLAIGQLTRLK